MLDWLRVKLAAMEVASRLSLGVLAVRAARHARCDQGHSGCGERATRARRWPGCGCRRQLTGPADSVSFVGCDAMAGRGIGCWRSRMGTRMRWMRWGSRAAVRRAAPQRCLRACWASCRCGVEGSSEGSLYPRRCASSATPIDSRCSVSRARKTCATASGSVGGMASVSAKRREDRARHRPCWPCCRRQSASGCSWRASSAAPAADHAARAASRCQLRRCSRRSCGWLRPSRCRGAGP